VSAGDTVIGAFSEEHAGQLTGVSRKQLRHWDRIGLLHPSYGAATGLPYGRIYSFRDLVSLRVLGQLRNVHKVPISHLKDTFRALSLISDTPWASTTLRVRGKSVVVIEADTKRRYEPATGQEVLDLPLKVVITGLRSAVAKLNERGAEEVGKVVQERFIAQNQPVMAGTRIPVTLIRSFADAGYGAAAIIKEYPDLTETDVRAALAYESTSAAA